MFIFKLQSPFSLMELPRIKNIQLSHCSYALKMVWDSYIQWCLLSQKNYIKNFHNFQEKLWALLKHNILNHFQKNLKDVLSILKKLRVSSKLSISLLVSLDLLPQVLTCLLKFDLMHLSLQRNKLFLNRQICWLL